MTDYLDVLAEALGVEIRFESDPDIKVIDLQEKIDVIDLQTLTGQMHQIAGRKSYTATVISKVPLTLGEKYDDLFWENIHLYGVMPFSRQRWDNGRPDQYECTVDYVGCQIR